MQIAFLLYEGLTALDVVGPYDVLSRLPGVDVRFVALAPGEYKTDTGTLGLTAAHALADVPSPDVFVVGGGLEGTLRAARDETILAWLRGAHETSQFSTSVCTGSLILGAAGLLSGLEATTHWAAKEMLTAHGATYVAERVVRRGKIFTAAGVSAGIDMALTLAAAIAGDDAARAIQLGIEYDPQPPFDSGSPANATPELMQLALAGLTG